MAASWLTFSKPMTSTAVFQGNGDLLGSESPGEELYHQSNCDERLGKALDRADWRKMGD
jgi:hypothetical protein